MKNIPTLYTAHEAAQVLRLTNARAVDHLRKIGKIGYVLNNGKYFYREEHIQDYLEKATVWHAQESEKQHGLQKSKTHPIGISIGMTKELDGQTAKAAMLRNLQTLKKSFPSGFSPTHA